MINNTHENVGQMDMYVRMLDELKRPEGDDPTIEITLCTDKDETIKSIDDVSYIYDKAILEKYVGYGRANVPGQAVFYGSVLQKCNVPGKLLLRKRLSIIKSEKHC